MNSLICCSDAALAARPKKAALVEEFVRGQMSMGGFSAVHIGVIYSSSYKAYKHSEATLYSL